MTTPAHVFSTSKGSTTVIVTLYGDVTDERLQRERVMSAHRAEQLNWQRPVPREFAQRDWRDD